MRCRFTPWIFAALMLVRGFAAEVSPSPQNELGRFIVKNYTTRDYGSGPQTWDCVQDARGVLYVGCVPGVLTFDGVTWRQITIPGSVASCRGLALAPDGTIYVGGVNIFGYLRALGDGRHEFVSLVDRLPEAQREFKAIYQIHASGDAVYAEAAAHVLVWRGGKLARLPGSENPRLSRTKDAVYYQSNLGGPLSRIEGETMVQVTADPVLAKDNTRFLATAPDGALLVGTHTQALFALRDGKLVPWPTAVDEFLRTKKIFRGWQLADGSLAIAIERDGLVFLSPTGALISYLDDTNGLQNPSVHSLWPDRDGGYWVGLNNGIAHLGRSPTFTFFNRLDGLPASGINDLRRYADTLYVATTQGIFRLVPAANVEATARFERVTEGSFFSLHENTHGLFAGESRGVFALTPTGFQPTLKLNSPAYTIIRSRRSPDLLWVGQNNGVRALRRAPDGWRDEGRVTDLNETVRSLVEMPDGKLWGSTQGRGVFRLTPAGPTAATTSPSVTAKIERFPPVPGQTRLERVAEWNGELVFTADRENTLFQFEEAARRFVPLRGTRPLPDGLKIGSNVFGANQPDALWLSTTYRKPEDKRILRVARDGGMQVLPQSVHDGIGNPTRFYEERGPTGAVLWIGGVDGLLRVEVARAFAPPAPYAAAVWTSQNRVRPGDTLPFGKGDFEFEFVAPRFAPEFPVNYQTRLVGDDDAWSDWSAKRQRTFNHLAEGAYRFEVRARDVDGFLSAPAALAFTILPPWWRTWWAYGGYVAALGLTIYGSVRLRTRALQAKNERLEKIVATRTEDLRRQNGELARLHKLELDEKISARLVAEKAQLDVLRYQLNPHFLFNSLTSIRSQIPPALGSARDTLDRLADFCRLTLHGRKAEERTTVGEEIAMLRAYLDIEQTRMGELLSVTFDVEASLDAVLMPRLLLLPLVENALKYGQATSEDALGIKIAARRAGSGSREAFGSDETLTRSATEKNAQGVVFEISNTGTWVERGSRPGIPSTGIGHENLRERLLRHYPDAFVFSHSAADGWVHVRLELKAAAKTP